MEEISSEGWKRDGLLIVCFGSPDCGICEMLRVLNFFNFRFTPDSFVQRTDYLFTQPIIKRANVSLHV